MRACVCVKGVEGRVVVLMKALQTKIVLTNAGWLLYMHLVTAPEGQVGKLLLRAAATRNSAGQGKGLG